MLIRPVRESDLQICGEIYAAAFSAPPYREAWSAGSASEMLSGLLARDPESCWCVEEEGRVVGFAFCTTFGKLRATIQEFAISPGFQRKGIGTDLMNHVLAEFKRRAIDSVELIVNRDAPAFMFYRRFGFRQPDRYVLMIRRV